jgi:RNA polymerase sigma factor (sigma-70 family)
VNIDRVMDDLGDIELLDAWRLHGDRAAIDRLVRRHIHFVYGAARRQVRDPHRAEDVTQAVFMLLIQKSPNVRSEAALAVWLHRATRYAAANARRMIVRQTRRDTRFARQQGAAGMDDQLEAVEQADEQARLLPVLDDAIGRLPLRDRSGVILCFFRGQTYGQIGAALGTSEEGARKRVTRAVARLREYFAARGVVASDGAIGACLAGQSILVAPHALVESTVKLATVAQIAGAAGVTTSSSAAIMKGVVKSMMLAKVKIAAAACAAIVLGGVVTGSTVHQIFSPVSRAVLTSATATIASNAAATDGPFKVAVPDKLEAEFLGLNKAGAGASGWWAIDGSPIDDPRGPFTRFKHRAHPEVTHEIVLRVTGPADGGYAVRIPGVKTDGTIDLTPSDIDAFLLAPFPAPKDKKTIDVELLLADGEWKTLGTSEHEVGRPLQPLDTEYGGVAFTHISETSNGHAMVYVAHEFLSENGQWEVFAVDAQGNEHRCTNIDGNRVGNFYAMSYIYNLPPEQITGLTVKVRPFNKKVTAKNVTLDPKNPTKPEIVVSDVELDLKK